VRDALWAGVIPSSLLKKRLKFLSKKAIIMEYSGSKAAPISAFFVKNLSSPFHHSNQTICFSFCIKCLIASLDLF
jgi:hypothetical protein